MQRGQRCQLESSATWNRNSEVHGPFNESVGMILWKPHSWNQWAMNSEPLPPKRRKPPSWGRNLSCQRPHRLLHPSRNVQKPLSPRNLLSRLILFHPLAPSFPTPKPCHHPSWKTKKSLWGSEPESPPTPDADITYNWIWYYIEKSGKILNWWGNSGPFATWVLSPSMTSKSKT